MNLNNHLLLSECLDIAEDFFDEEDFELFKLKVESECHDMTEIRVNPVTNENRLSNHEIY